MCYTHVNKSSSQSNYIQMRMQHCYRMFCRCMIEDCVFDESEFLVWDDSQFLYYSCPILGNVAIWIFDQFLRMFYTFQRFRYNVIRSQTVNSRDKKKILWIIEVQCLSFCCIRYDVKRSLTSDFTIIFCINNIFCESNDYKNKFLLLGGENS